MNTQSHIAVVREALVGMLLKFASEDLTVCLSCNYEFNNPKHNKNCRANGYVNSLEALSLIEKELMKPA